MFDAFNDFNIPDRKTPIALCEVESPEQISKTAIKNEGEARMIVRTIKRLLKKNVAPDQIGVIAFYALQVDYIKDLLFQDKIYGVEVNSVDGFQGRDKDIILISMVRCNKRRSVGFCDDSQRMNVAVTRAKEWIMFFCDKETIQNAQIWKSYFSHYKL